MTPEDMIEVIKAHAEGKDIEAKSITMPRHERHWSAVPYPAWDFSKYDYRVVTKKPSINWDHVRNDLNYLAVDAGGDAYLYASKPIMIAQDEMWRTSDEEQIYVGVEGFASYQRGNVDWKDSLITRPNIIELPE